MIQDIEPRLWNQFEYREAKADDSVFVFDGSRVMIKRCEKDGKVKWELPAYDEIDGGNAFYLFSIGEKDYFLALEVSGIPEEYSFRRSRELRTIGDRAMAFAVATGYHLYQWYRDNRYCGRCGTELLHDCEERMLCCPACKNKVYPKVAPAVIVGVTCGDKILFTKYAGRAYKKHALIAGFVEIGETAEETVRREVLEEVGLKVKNIKYYKSQPWGYDSNLLLGFFAELDGSDRVQVDGKELAEAQWFSRNEISVDDDGISLTREMMRVFMEGKEDDERNI